MIKMTKIAIGLHFEPNEPLNKLGLYFPESTEILSIETKNNQPVLYVNFQAPTEMFGSKLWKEICFYVHKSNYVGTDFSEYNYLGEICFGNDSFKVYYKKGLIA